MAELVLNNVKYTYKSKYQTVNALKGITYEFEPRKFYALIGRSGSGKTTLLSLLAALDLPTGGQVIYQDKPTSEIDRDLYHRDTVAVIYQSYNLLPLLSVMENVTFPLELKKAPNAKKIAEEKNCRCLGVFYCKGFDTFGPFKLVGGINKNRPNTEDMEQAVQFYRGLNK